MSNYAFRTLKSLGLSESLSYSIIPKLKLSSLDSDQKVWIKGETVDEWKYIMTGTVALTVPSNIGETSIIDIRSENSWIGEELMLTRNFAPFECVCITACEFLTISRELFIHLMKTEILFSNIIANMIALRAAREQEAYMLLRLGSPCLRVVQGLALVVEDLISSNFERTSTQIASIPAKQSILASLCGVSRAVMSQHLQILQVNGWLSIEYGYTKFSKIGAWKEFIDNRRKGRMFSMDPCMKDMLGELEKANNATKEVTSENLTNIKSKNRKLKYRTI